jgi:excisionase family DNA binding protein
MPKKVGCRCVVSTEWLTVEEIAQELKVPLDTVRSWIRRKELKAYRPGREYRVKREDLERFLKESATIDDDSQNKDA